MFQSSHTSIQTTLNAVCVLQIDDTSDYTAGNGEPLTHDRSFFDKKRVIITNPDGVQYIMDSVDNPPVVDENIDAPSVGVSADQNIYTFGGNDGNGTYTITLISVPTWQNGQTYNQTDSHVVYLAGIFYQTTIDGNTNDPTVGPGWQVIGYTELLAITKYTSSTTVAVNCLTAANYQTLLYDSTYDTYSVDVSDTCTTLTIEDNSLYANNNQPGHDITDFSDYRRIVITRPNGTQYIMSSISATDVDEIIAAPSSGNNTINYSFIDDTDEDGLYDIRICSFPTWRDTANYTLIASPVIVYHDGTLYQLKQTGTGQQPDLSPTYWEEYTLDSSVEFTTNYCYIAKIAVLCFNMLKCYETLVHDAFCVMDTNFCNDDVLCKNKKFLNAMKMRVLLDAVQYSMSRRQWNEVEKQFNLMRQLCNC